MPNDFEAFAKAALGTDDPERIAALKEAIVACVEEHETGGYEDEAVGDESLSMLFGAGGGKKAK